MRFHVRFILDVESQEQAVSLRDGAKEWLQAQGATVSAWDAARVDPEYHVYGAQLTTDGTLVPRDGIFVATDEADATAQALASIGGTAVVSYVQRIG